MSKTSFDQKGRAARRRRKGVALLLVLSCVVLLTLLVVAFLSNVGSELRSSKLYANGASVKLLSQSAVNIVQSEINDATHDGTLCWASQPGMIRTYSVAGSTKKYYKLYSDDNMVVDPTNGGTYDHTKTLVPDGTTTIAGSSIPWYNQTGVYVDLNQPVSVAGNYMYPIVDGNLTDMVSYTTTLPGTLMPTAATTVLALGPTVTTGVHINQPQVAGFWVNKNAPINAASSHPNQAPMPVKWLYVLADGSVATPDSATTANKNVVSFTKSAAKPSAGNPITGRMAFWTDDDTSKVNVNTAAEGSYNSQTTAGTNTTTKTSYVDTPRVCTQFDLQMANCAPFQNEFQRYPGHPATVSLSAVFGNLSTDTTFPENVYGIVPRTVKGGSTEATVGNVLTNPTPLSITPNRLFSTSDEFIFQPTVTGTGRPVNSTYIDKTAMQKAQFFLTASSRAPDVNLFNQPRVSMWPISSYYGTGSVNSYCTAFDQLIAFCSTVNGAKYFFQRKDYTSPSELDPAAGTFQSTNFAILNYIKTLASAPIPGFGDSSGNSFATKYATTNSTGGSELDQILTEIFDYVRCVNLSDTSSLVTSGGTTQINPFAPYNSNTNNSSGEVVPTWNQYFDTKGFGRMETISKVGILFIGAGDSVNKQVVSVSGTVDSTGTVTSSTPTGSMSISASPVTTGTTTTNYVTTTKYGPDVPAGKVRVRALLLFELFDPAQGYTGLYPGASINVLSSALTWSGSALGTQTMFGFGTSGSSVTGTVGASAYQSQAWGGYLGSQPLWHSYLFSTASRFYTTVPGASTTPGPYPDFPAGGNITVNAGDVIVQVQRGGVVTQTITLSFPNLTCPVPTVWPVSSVKHTNTGRAEPYYLSNFTDPDSSAAYATGRLDVDTNQNYLGSGQNVNYKYLITSKDTVASLQSPSGDIRMSAALKTIPSGNSLFQPHPNWGQQMAHSFTANNAEPYYGATRGQYVKNVTSYWTSGTAAALATPFPYNDAEANWNVYTAEPPSYGSTTTTPAVGLTAGSTASWTPGNPPGDFDNGTGITRDGPFINKPDEGVINLSGGYPPYFTGTGGYQKAGRTYFSPARQMPSAAMLGSLPTGVLDNRPWQTLLFHPDPTGKHVGNKDRGGTGSAAAGMPGDYLMLDFFNMPVVEPYAISEPLSTAGRINMNYLIVPFNYINRDTGVRAVLESQQILAIPNTANSGASAYKQQLNNAYNAGLSFSGSTNKTLRYSVNLDETLKGFIARFNTGDIFRSSAEICTLPLVPGDPSASYANCTDSLDTYWSTHQLTGDNSRERPYANIYPLLTTKSNTYTVHFRVQTLKKAMTPGYDGTTWTEGTDQITGEYRGSETIERYVDPNNSQIPDFTANPSTTVTLAPFYQFRVVSLKEFAP